MAASIAVMAGRGSSSSWMGFKDKNEKIAMNRVKRFCASASATVLTDPYKTLRIQPSASESEVKKAFRQLALQYHPDVCRGGDCRLQFSGINEAYDVVMANLRGGSTISMTSQAVDNNNDSFDDESSFQEADDLDSELWEEWMGWEGAGIRDYSSHINPYI